MADVNRIVHTRTPKTSDIEVHTSSVDTENGTFVEVREYVKSLDQYGRGITVPATKDMLAALIVGLQNVEDRVLESTS